MQRLSAIMSDGNLAAPSAGTVNAGNASGDFQKIITNLKSTGNKSNTVKDGMASAVQKKDTSVNPSGVYENTNDNVSQISRKSSQELDTGKTEAFTQKDFLQVEDEVKAVVKDTLGLDEDVFQQTLASMGITAIQLLDPKVLQQFVVQVNGGTDATDLLTSENMMQQFSELSARLLDADWNAMTGFTGQQLSEMTAEQFDDSELIQNLLDQSGGDAQTVTEETLKADDQTGNQEISQTEAQPVTADDASEAVMTGQEENVLAASADPGENVRAQVVSQNAGQAEQTELEKTVVNNEDVILMSGDAQENVSDTGAEDLMQNAFQNGEETGSRSEDLVSYVEDSPVTVTESQTLMNFVENMVQASNVELIQEPVNMQQMIDIVNQVVERVHSSLQDETTTLEMQLNPERLGKMLLTVNSRDGVMTASITVQNAEAKAALESQMITLRENLEQKNLKVEAVEVSVSDFAFSQSGQTDTGDQKNFQQGNGKRSRFRFESDEEETEDQEETAQSVRRSIMPDSGSSVDFTA